jgi:PKD domain
MRLAPVFVGVLAVALAASGFAETKPKRPRLDVRASPRVAMSPARVVAVVQLVGGDDVEEYYCPGLEWDWGDGSVSFRESDCEPFEPGATVQRRYSASHVYASPGNYSVRVSLRRAEHTLASNAAQVMVRGFVAGLEN